jgi:hypothetical protein
MVKLFPVEKIARDFLINDIIKLFCTALRIENIINNP